MSVSDPSASGGFPPPPDLDSGSSRGDRVVSPDFASDDTCDTFVAALDDAARSVSRVGGAPSGALPSGGSVDAGLAALLSQVTAHPRRIEEILFENKTEISNGQRALIITETNGMVKACAEFQAAAAWRDGAVQELRRQLDEARREAAELRVRVPLGGSPAPGRSFADVVAGRRDDAGALPLSSELLGVRGPPSGFDFSSMAQDRPGPAGQPQHVAFITPFKANTTLLPDVWGDVLSLGHITKTVRKKSPFKGAKPSTPTVEDIEYLLDNPEDDSIAQQLYPPRNEADMGTRNLRMADMLTYGIKTGRRARLAEVLAMCRGFDYILTSNLLTAIFCFGELWWQALTQSGVFEGDSEHYRTS
ncbi:hypothetical protein MTO96_052195 [Rhipicephalus appendiculatus]